MGAYRTAVMSSGPELFLDLNETSGTTATDSSGFGRNGTYQRGAASAALPVTPNGDTGSYEGALGKGLVVPHAAWQNSPDMAVEFTIYVPTDANESLFIAGKIDPDVEGLGLGWQIFLTGTSMSVYISPYSAMTFAFTRGVAHHLIISGSSGGSRCFLDGTQVATAAGGAARDTSATAPVKIGWRTNDDVYTAVGVRIDDFAMFGYGLDSSDAGSHYAATGFGGGGLDPDPPDDTTNDMLANAFTVTFPTGKAVWVSPSVSNVAASTETGENTHPASYDLGHTLWWRWVAPASENVCIDSVLSGGGTGDYDTELGIYRLADGALPDFANLTKVAQDSDGGTGYRSVAWLPVTAGKTYYFQLGGYQSQTFTNLILRVSRGSMVPLAPGTNLPGGGGDPDPDPGDGTDVRTAEPQHLGLFLSGGGPSGPPQLAMVIYNPVEERAATSIQVTVGGASPGATLSFALDGATLWTATADAQGNLDLTAIPVPASYDAGAHTLRCVSLENGEDTDTFTLLKDAAEFPVDQTEDVSPVLLPGSQGRFVFQDLLPGGIGSWIMPSNPAAMTNPEFTRTVTDTHTTAIWSGQFHLSEGFQAIPTWKLSGYCPNEAYHLKLKAYAALRRRIYVIDHRGRAWICAVADYSLESRKRKAEDTGQWNDWTGNWTMDLAILDQDWKTPEAP